MTSNDQSNREELHELLAGLSDAAIAELTVRALRDCRKARPREQQFSMHAHLGHYLLPLLADRAGRALTEGRINALQQQFVSIQGDPLTRPIIAAVWSLIRAGYFVPTFTATGDGHLLLVHVTRSGERLLDATDDHPALPGFLDRVSKRCPGLPDEVVLHLVDAQACLDHGLLRPGVVLAGLAYEVAVDALLQSLIGRKLAPSGAMEEHAAKRLTRLKTAAEQLSKEERYEVLDALDFAGSMRARRNDASHPTPTYPFDDAGELEELLCSAGRRLPALWTLCSRP